MTTQEAIDKGVEGGWRHYKGYDFDEVRIIPSSDLIDLVQVYSGGSSSHTISLQEMLLDPKFFQALGKSMGWGQSIYRTERGYEWGKRICLHCGMDCEYQPPKEKGSNHAHFPEACNVCSKKAKTSKEYWHALIDHLAEGETIEDYFKDL